MSAHIQTARRVFEDNVLLVPEAAPQSLKQLLTTLTR